LIRDWLKNNAIFTFNLATGIPLYPYSVACAVAVMKGGQNGLTVDGKQLWTQECGTDDTSTDLSDLDDTSEFAGYFGASMPGSAWQ